MQPTSLTSTRLVLTAPTTADIAVMTEFCQDPEITRYVPVPVPYTDESARYFIEQLVPAGWAADAEYNWAVRSADGSFLGMIGARRLTANAARFDVGLWLGEPHRGHGYASEAVAAVIHWLFENDIASALTWVALVGNGASVRVARKLGFAFTGTRPSAGAFRDGAHPSCWHAELGVSDDRAANEQSWESFEAGAGPAA